jgi:hypothetical protein
MTHPLSVNGTDTRLGGRYANAKPHMFIAFVREFRQRTAGDERARERLFTVLPGPEFSPCHVHRHGAPLQIARAGVYVSRDKRISSPKPLPASLRVTANMAFRHRYGRGQISPSARAISPQACIWRWG